MSSRLVQSIDPPRSGFACAMMLGGAGHGRRDSGGGCSSAYASVMLLLFSEGVCWRFGDGARCGISLRGSCSSVIVALSAIRNCLDWLLDKSTRGFGIDEGDIDASYLVRELSASRLPSQVLVARPSQTYGVRDYSRCSDLHDVRLKHYTARSIARYLRLSFFASRVGSSSDTR